MKQTIAWHEEGLKNSEATLQKEKKRILQSIETLNRFEKDQAFCAWQLECAKKAKKDGYDNERYKIEFTNNVAHPIHTLVTE